MKTLQKTLMNATLASSFTSEVLDLRHLYCFSLQVIAAGSAFGGSWVFQGSNDEIDPTFTSPVPTNWTTIGSSTNVSAAGSTMTNLDGQGYAWGRFVFTTGGTPNGTLTVKFNGKGA